MPFDEFHRELERLVSLFKQKQSHKSFENYDEQSLRNDFLNPLWRSLGWDLENIDSLPQSLREVQIETRVDIAGKAKRADYIFRTDGINRFVCEAKAVREDLLPKHAYQTQRYAFNLRVLVGVLTNFRSIRIFIVGAKPEPLTPFQSVVEWQVSDYLEKAAEIWNLLGRANIAAGTLDSFIAAQRKVPYKGKARQGWLIPVKRVRPVDYEFLADIEQYRISLAGHLVRWNQEIQWDDLAINEAVQRIIDRILFVRICEDRAIETGQSLESILEEWASIESHRPSLYSRLVSKFRDLDIAFNGALFKEHFSESLVVPDTFLGNMISELASDDSPYLFNTLPVEIIGSVYERFIGKTIHVTKGLRPKAEVLLKPEIRKAGGVFYTPQYIVNYIVEETIGPLLKGKSPKQVSRLRFLDPACGSGSFLIRVFERVCEHYVRWYERNPKDQSEADCYRNSSGQLQLTTHLKHKIMKDNVFGVDVDAQAIEVTMLSLYLKILEGETRSTLGMQRRLFPKETFLPDLSNNIKLGNSLIESDYLSTSREDSAIVHTFDWDLEFGTSFSAAVGNPPYVTGTFISALENAYLKNRYKTAAGKFDLYMVFLEKAMNLVGMKGNVGFIIPNKFMVTRSGRTLRSLLSENPPREIVDFRDSPVFENVTNYPCVLIIRPTEKNDDLLYRYCESRPEREIMRVTVPIEDIAEKPWFFSETETANLLETIYSGSDGTLSDEIERFSTGIQTGSDKVLMLTQEDASDHSIETKYLRKCLRGRDIKRFSVRWQGKYVCWPYDQKNDDILSDDALKRLAPNLYNLLKGHKSKLAKRIWFGKTAEELSGKWFGLMYREPERNFTRLHIVTPSLASAPSFALNTESFHFVTGTAGVTGLLPNEPGESACYYLLGLLNSSVVRFILREASPKFANGFYKFTGPYLKTVPMPIGGKKGKGANVLRDQIANAARLMGKSTAALELARADAEKSRVRATLAGQTRNLDLLVAKSYGLSNEILDQIRSLLERQEAAKTIKIESHL